MKYVSLHHHSTFSYMDGFGTPDQHVKRAAELGMSALALTEHGNTSSHVKLEQAAAQYGVKPLYGAELYTAAEVTRRKWHLTVLAMNEQGYRNLNVLVSRSYSEGFYQWPTVFGDMLAEHNEGLIVLSGCADSKLSCDLLGGKGRDLHEDSPDYDLALDTVRKFKRLLGDRYYLECQQFPELARTRTLNPVFAKLSAATGVPLVATADCHYPHPDDNEMQVVLHAAGRGAGSAAEQAESWEYDIRLTHPTSDAQILERLRWTGLSRKQAQAAVQATADIADRCNVTLPRAPRLRFPVPAGMTTADYIWQKLREGWAYRYARNKRMQAHKAEYGERLKYEMEMILAKDFADYFLMLNDVVPYVKDHGCPVGPARGSAAASLACYLLRITEVDPLQFPTMVFERFIDITREDLPDVDLDFADDKRDMVRDRLVAVWGEDRVGNIGTFTKYKGKNAIDDIARVYHIPKSEADAVKGVIVERSGGDARSDETLADTLDMFPAAQAAVDRNPKLNLAMRLEGNYRGFGVHAAGLVVGNTKLTDVCAMYTRHDSKAGHSRTVLAYDMKDAETLGMMKLDALGLSTMGMIDIALGLIGMNLEELYAIDMEDQPTLTAFRDGDVVGIFQFEGRATRLVTSQVRPTTFMELSDINALSRPGPLFSGATRKYIDTKLGVTKPELLHPIVDAITAQSQHQVIYQEQILKIVREVGDFSWTHAAAVRKIISKKKGEAAFNFNKQNFIDGAARLHGMKPALADTIWRTIVTSGTYAFNVAHCISYSMLGFWAMWLKVNYPHEFYTAQLIKTEEAKWGPLLRDAAEHGVEVRPPDIKHSTAGWTLTPDKVIAAGFSQIKGVGEKTAQAIMAAREDEPFSDWGDLIRVPGIGPKTIVSMRQACESDDFFGLKRVARVLHAVKQEPGMPHATHNIDALIAQKQMGKDFTATVYLMVKQFNYQDAVEKERAKTGEEEEVILKRLKHPELRTMVSIYCYDEGDEPFSVRVTRWQYNKLKAIIQAIRPHKDVIVVRGTVLANFGNMLFPEQIAVIDPEG